MTAPRASLAGVAVKGKGARPERVPGAAADLQPPLRESMVSMNVRFPPDMHRRLKVLAFTSGRPISEHFLEAVAAYLRGLE